MLYKGASVKLVLRGKISSGAYREGTPRVPPALCILLNRRLSGRAGQSCVASEQPKIGGSRSEVDNFELNEVYIWV